MQSHPLSLIPKIFPDTIHVSKVLFTTATLNQLFRHEVIPGIIICCYGITSLLYDLTSYLIIIAQYKILLFYV